jgi:molybdopterin-containing oxidoreductase family iron-sulfur binding subunit
LNCLVACPYGARQLYPENGEDFPGQGITPYEEISCRKYTTGVVGKCDFCLPRIEKGLKPACVESCMTKARYFGDLDDPDSEVSRLINSREAYQIDPAVGFPSSQASNSVVGEVPEIDPSVYYLAP